MTDAMATIVAGAVEARIDGNGALLIGCGESPDWFGPARLVGTDVAASAWQAGDGITADGGWVTARVAALAGADALVVELAATAPHADATALAFDEPVVALAFDPTARAEGGAPAGLRAFGHQYMEFALPVFSDAACQRWRLLPFRPAAVVPFGLIAPDGRTLLLAPLDAFHEHIVAVPDRRHPDRHALLAGWHGDIGAVDAGFRTRFVIVAGDTPRGCFATWARLLREASGIAAPDRDADTLASRLSYWTDNGSAYWYRTEADLDVASSIVSAVDDLEAQGVRVGAVQLDSWWYPHAVLRPFNTDAWEVPPTGMLRWEPRDDVLPGGIHALRERLGRRPLVTHCRHLSAESPYCDAFPVWVDGDRAHPSTPALYERLLDQAVGWGVEVFEHDWLVECFLGVRALRAAGRAAEWQRGLDDALSARGLHAQWCMATPADFAATTALRNVTSIRTSGDHGYIVGPEVLWAWFVHTNVMARVLGLSPYKDVFLTSSDHPERDVEALLAALSAGPVGVGDRAGHADVALIRRTCRADGVLVRPDVPVAATDRALYDAPVWSSTLLTASTHTRHAAGRWAYLVTMNVSSTKERMASRVALDDARDDMPESARVAVYDWRRGTIEVSARDATLSVTLDHTDWDYRIVAPVLETSAGPLAVVGDPAVYATAGNTRLADVALDGDGRVTITLLGGGEHVELVGWAPTPPSLDAWTPADGSAPLTPVHDGASGLWRVGVDIGETGWIEVRTS